jgi:MFS family permease
MGITAPGSPTALTWILLVVVQVFNVAESGLELAANNMQLNIAPRQHNTAYLATYAAVFSLCSAISPLIGGALLSQPTLLLVTAGPLSLSGFQTLFVISGLLRLSSAIFAPRVPER